MATKISESTSSTAASTDLVPIAKSGDATARRVTADALVKAVQASTSGRGSVELATTAETQAGTDTERAVTPAGVKAYFDQTVLCGDDFKLKIPGQTRPEYFQLYVDEALFDGVYDPVAYWGFNVNGVGGRVDGDLPAIYMQFEADYYVGGKHVQEWSFNCYPDTGSTVYRYMAFVNNRDDYTETYWQFWTGNTADSFFSVDDVETNDIYFRILPYSGYMYTTLDTSILGRLEICEDLSIGSHSAALEVSRTLTPSSTCYGVDLIPTISPTAAITTAGVRILPTYNVPASTTQNTLVGLDVVAPTINEGSDAETYYAYTMRVVGAPTVGVYGNWALWVTGQSGIDGNLLIGNDYSQTATDPVDIMTGTIRMRTAKTPSSAGDTGRTGQICWDTSYIYICVGTNTWKRAEISTWA